MAGADGKRAERPGGKCARQRLPSLGLVEAPGSQIKERGFVQLTDRRPVRALDVVGVNFKLRLGIDFRALRQEQVMVGLARVGAVGAFLDDGLKGMLASKPKEEAA